MEAKLIVVGGEAKTTEVRLKLPTVIGRGREASLMVPHPLVSRRHCELYEQDGRLVVRDLGSLNGTYINNQKVVGEAVLPSGQLLTIGAVTFRAVYDAAAEARRADSTGPAVSLNETVYAGEGTKPVDPSRRPPRKTPDGKLPTATAADATVDATAPVRATGERAAPAAGSASPPPSDEVEFDELRIDDSWSETDKPSAPPAAGSGQAEPQRPAHDSDDLLNDFLRNLQ